MSEHDRGPWPAKILTVSDGVVAAAAEHHFSVMGYQQEGADVWRAETGPEIAARSHDAQLDAVILAPA